MITKNLSALNIHKLTQKQYEREYKAGNLDETALYLTPDPGVDATLTKEGIAADAKATGEAIAARKYVVSNAPPEDINMLWVNTSVQSIPSEDEDFAIASGTWVPHCNSLNLSSAIGSYTIVNDTITLTFHICGTPLSTNTVEDIISIEGLPYLPIDGNAIEGKGHLQQYYHGEENTITFSHWLLDEDTIRARGILLTSGDLTNIVAIQQYNNGILDPTPIYGSGSFTYKIT